MLLVDQRWIQETIAGELAAAVAADPRLTERLTRRLAEVIGRDHTDVAYRARAVRALEAVGARDAIAAALALDDERLQGAAALSLARLKDPRGLPMTRALTEDDAVAVAAEALTALGLSGDREQALVPLLRVLNPDLDRALVRAALVALGALGDLRAVRPLVAFLREAPDYLRHRVVASLRQLTGATLGRGEAGWVQWVADHDPPAAPAVATREVAPDDSLGLPPP
jgi:HEAT repeat protein